MIIALDFDRTLFDRDRMYEYFKDHKELKDFDIGLDFKIKFSELTDLCVLGNDFSEFLYDDVIDFLNKYKENELILLSSALYSISAQETTIRNTNISKYFKEVHIVDSNSKKGDILSKYNQKVIFLDDLVSNLEDVQNKCKDSTVVLMDRNNVADNKDFPIVSGLKEFEAFI